MIDLTLLAQDLTGQIELVRSKKLSAQEINQQQLALIEKINPTINAFISVTETLEEHSSLETNVLSNLSIAVKDNIDVSGFNTTAGLLVKKNIKATSDAFVIAKLRAAGGVFSGKLNMHEGALGASNQNAHFGNCYNPHQLDASPGGSSGGSGAAVASGMTALALGTDTMGSVRIPASYCGVFALKPSRGALSNKGTIACSRIMDTIGPIARSARDLSLAMNIMSGFDLEDANSRDISFIDDLPNRPILLVPEELESFGVSQDIIADFTRSIDAFKLMGCQIKYFSMNDYDFGAARRAGLIICEAEMRVEHQQDWHNNRSGFSPYLNNLLSYIDRKSPMDVISAERHLDKAIVKGRSILKHGHFILMPTTPQRAFTFEQPVPANQADLTSLANQAGLPALSIPMISANALPIGMQLVGPSGSDFQLIALAEKWQQHTEFTYRLPPTIAELLKKES